VSRDDRWHGTSIRLNVDDATLRALDDLAFVEGRTWDVEAERLLERAVIAKARHLARASEARLVGLVRELDLAIDDMPPRLESIE